MGGREESAATAAAEAGSGESAAVGQEGLGLEEETEEAATEGMDWETGEETEGGRAAAEETGEGGWAAESGGEARAG